MDFNQNNNSEEKDYSAIWDDEKPSMVKSTLMFAFELIKVIAISVAIILPVRMFLFQPFYVQGASMEPNFFDKEYLIIDEISYRFSFPERGDIIVFKYPRDPGQYFIKRIIGLPGEKVKVSDGKVIIFNDKYPAGTILDESGYLKPDVRTNGEQEVTLRADEYFVMGDNRYSSLDSRIFGPVARGFLVGRTWLRGWPFYRFTHFETPNYNL